MIMTAARFRRPPSLGAVILFLGVAAVSVAALVWMGVRRIKQDRALQSHLLRERREAAADRLTASLEQVLSEEERKLADLLHVDFRPPEDDVVLVFAGLSGSPSPDFRVWPENGLLYYPVITPRREASARLFAEAERYEFINRDFRRAIRDLLPFSTSGDPTVRASAQLRLARNFRKAGNPESALQTYDEMVISSDHEISISGVPVDLAARRARCALLG